MAILSGREQGASPNCSTTYSSRWKPSNCSKCGFQLGDSAPVAKAQKMSCPSAINICSRLYLIHTDSRDYRSLVSSENNLWISLHSDWKDVQAANVSSDRAVEFTCQHIKQAPDSACVLDMYNLTAAKIAAYPCDALTKAMLHNISILLGRKAVQSLQPDIRCLWTPKCYQHPWVFHIKVENAKKVDTASHKCSC